jgi:3-methyladenine DNA glycosylase AlkD
MSDGVKPVTTAVQARALLRAAAEPGRVAVLQRFFKTGPGEYGEGDRFLGLRVPAVRALARRCELGDRAVRALLASPWHEDRLLALVVMTRAYARGDEARRQAIYDLYLEQTSRINNWDLVDVSAERIVGAHLFHRSRAPLDRLARSQSVWERRIAVIATFHFLRAGEPEPTLRLAHRLLRDPHDLIHKAVGWMLREVGKRDRARLEEFLSHHAPRMPRTMLRYAIERLPAARRRAWLHAA